MKVLHTSDLHLGKNLSEESVIAICDYLRDKTIKGDFKSAVKYINENFGVDIK